MPQSNLKLAGVVEMRAKFRRLAKNFPTETGRALFQETEIETTESKRRCPVDKGTLRGTIHTEGPFVENPGIASATIYTLIACGGPAAPYAIYVHENLQAFHKVGQAKFIESVVLESRPYMAQRVAKRINLNRALGA